MKSSALYALAAAVLFGASTPFAKVLVGTVDPILLAALLYLGSGIGLTLTLLVRRALRLPSGETPLRAADAPWLGGAILAGGVVGPALLMFGLSRCSASAGSLMLNLEGVFTALLAWFVFRENFDRRILLGMCAIVAGGVALSWSPGAGLSLSWGAVAVAGACLAWGVDNNLTRMVSGGDPIQVAALKGTVAGTVNLCTALAMGSHLPGPGPLAGAAALGLAGYGVSLVLFVLSLRHLGTARTGAYFAAAPFVGAAISVLALGEPLSAGIIAAAALMGLGVYLHLTESHDHEHHHHELLHEHRHAHDEHHGHTHEEETDPTKPHAHMHVHTPLLHVHPHFPDLHHHHHHR